jgi:ribonuclease P protein component
VLPARYRMTRSTEFGPTIKNGVRAVERDLVVHAQRCGQVADGGPRIGLVVGKSVGSSVHRHRVARRLRHVVRTLVAELDPRDRIVIRALPSSRHAISKRLEQELRSALRRAHVLPKGQR